LIYFIANYSRATDREEHLPSNEPLSGCEFSSIRRVSTYHVLIVV